MKGKLSSIDILLLKIKLISEFKKSSEPDLLDRAMRIVGFIAFPQYHLFFIALECLEILIPSIYVIWLLKM